MRVILYDGQVLRYTSIKSRKLFLLLKKQIVVRFSRSYFDIVKCAIIELHVLCFNIAHKYIIYIYI